MEYWIFNFFENTKLIGILILGIFISTPIYIIAICCYLCLAIDEISEICIDAKEKMRRDIAMIAKQVIVEKNKSVCYVTSNAMRFSRNNRKRRQSVACR